MTIILITIILYFSFKKPIVALVFLVHINLLRAIPQLNLDELCFVCTNESDLILSVILPLTAFTIILFKIDYKLKKVNYFFEGADIYFLATIILLIVYSAIFPDKIVAFDYTLRYLLIGCSYFYLSKILLFNNKNSDQIFEQFYSWILILAFVLGTTAISLALYSDFFDKVAGYKIPRVTIPGIHPIPFAQLLGLAAFISFAVFYTRGKLINLKSGFGNVLVSVLFVYLLGLMFAAKARGIILVTVLVIILYLILNKQKISKRNANIFIGVLIISVIIFVNYIDVDYLVDRIIFAFKGDKSITERIQIYTDSWSIFINNPFGIGVYRLIHYSFLEYPHNFYLENMISFGVLGIIVNIYFTILLIHYYLVTIKWRKTNQTIIVLFCLIMFFFLESMFSFTLWMHKGLYLSIGLFTAYHHYLKNQQKQHLINDEK